MARTFACRLKTEDAMTKLEEGVPTIATHDLESVTGGDPGGQNNNEGTTANPATDANTPPRGPITNPQWKPGDPIGPLVHR
jgi:hypothetical protein